MRLNRESVILITVLLYCFITSCQNNYKEEKIFLSESISRQGVVLDNYKYVVIIPGIGCHGCIQESEYFLKNNINNRNILFIISNPQSLKILQNKIKVKLDNYDNVIIDRESNYQVPTNNSAYPCVLYLDEISHQISEIDFQSPKNGALNKLSKVI